MTADWSTRSIGRLNDCLASRRWLEAHGRMHMHTHVGVDAAWSHGPSSLL